MYEMNKNTILGILQIIEYLKVEDLNLPLIMDILACKDNSEIHVVLPPVWNIDGDISTHINMIMHLLFLGITQSIGMLIKIVYFF